MKPVNSDDIEDDEDDAVDGSLEDRTRDYSGLKYVQKQLGEIWAAVERGYEDKQEQNNVVADCWDIYNCQINANQAYTGTSRVYVPIVRDAMEARETRFINMIFPSNNRYVDVVAEDGHPVVDVTSVMDTYVKRAKLRTKVVPAMIRTGDIGGQYALFPEWVERVRHVTSKKKVPELELDDGSPVEGSEEYDDVDYEEVTDEYPDVTVLDPRDYLILPVTVDDVDDADIVAVGRDFTKSKIKKFVKAGIFEKAMADQVMTAMSTSPKKLPNTGKDAAAAAGIRTDSKGNKVVKIQHVWAKLKIRGEQRMMLIHFAGEDMVLGCKRNPYWCDKVPLLHQPVEKNPNSIWGPPIMNEGIRRYQYQANDYANMGFDSGMYSMLPIVMTDPEKNPRAGSMVLAMASVWLVDPNSTKFAEFPPLWKEAMQIIGACKDQIFQSFGVNPAMIPHGNAGKKPSQAQIAQEQQVALESSADNVAVIQEGILSQLVEWFYELDYQYRTKDITVKKWGTLGIQATMDQVEPFQVRSRLDFKWYGTEGFKAAQQVQQQIAWLNVLRGLPPESLNGRKVDLGPAIEVINATILGPRVAPRVLIDQRHQMTMGPELENQMLEHEFPVQVHELDDDRAHIMSHFAHFQQALGLPPEVVEGSNMLRMVKGHINEHIKSAKMKAMAAVGARPGSQGGPGQPRIGAQPQAPTGAQNPPGAVSPDNMPLSMPRRGA